MADHSLRVRFLVSAVCWCGLASRLPGAGGAWGGTRVAPEPPSAESRNAEEDAAQTYGLTLGVDAEFGWEMDQRRYLDGREANPTLEADVRLRFERLIEGGHLKSVGFYLNRLSLFPGQTVHLHPEFPDPLDGNRHRVSGTTTRPPVVGHIGVNGSFWEGRGYSLVSHLDAGIVPVGGVPPLPGQSRRYMVQPVYQIVTDRYDTGVRLSGSIGQTANGEPLARCAVGVVRGDLNPLLGDNDPARSNSYPGYSVDGMVQLFPLPGGHEEGIGRFVLEGGAVVADAGSNPGEKTYNDSAVVGLRHQFLRLRTELRAGAFRTRSGYTWAERGQAGIRAEPTVSRRPLRGGGVATAIWRRRLDALRGLRRVRRQAG